MRIPLRGLGLLSRLFVFCVVLVGGLLAGPGVAGAFTPPSPQGAVTDTSGHLTADDDRVLEAEVAAYRARTTNEIGVLMLGSLGGEDIDDVAYTTFNTWKVGKKGADNGVLLVIAPNERKMRIETGKGVGDRLTDLQSSRILRERVGPLLKENRFKDAVLAGVQAIEAALGDTVPPAQRIAPSATKPQASSAATAAVIVVALIVVGGFVMFFCLIVLLIAKARRSPRGGSSYGSDGSYSSSSGGSDWSSSSSSSGGSDWSSGSSGGSDFGGSSGGGSDFGGGSSGGGGSSDSY